MRPLHLGLILLINVVWALNIVAIKESVLLVDPIFSVALRYGVVFLVCCTYLKIVKGRMGAIILTSVLAGAVQFGLGASAFHVSTNLSALAIAAQLGVPLSLLLAVAIDGERIHWKRGMGILLAFIGVLLLVFDPMIVNERLGILLTLLSSVVWAVSNLLFRRLAGVPILTIYAWQAVASIPALLLASYFIEPGAIAGVMDITLQAMVWIIFSGAVASLVGHAGLTWLVQRYPVSTITPFMLLTPVLAITLATNYYGTPITPMMWIGGALTLTGVAIITLRTKAVAAKNPEEA